MPDRRQGDRRDTSKLEKKISVSLGNFIFICVIFILVIASIFLCSYTFAKGYDLGLEEVNAAEYDSGYSDGYNDGYDECLANYSSDYDDYDDYSEEDYELVEDSEATEETEVAE